MRQLLHNSKFRIWLAVVGAATLVMGTAYTMVQQSARLSADDLPLTTAQMIKHQLESGVSPTDVVPSTTTNLRSDNTVFAIVTNASNHVLASSANLDSHLNLPPSGTFDYTQAHGNDHFTWEPVSGVRLATRMMTYGKDGGFIITGQSLKQYESRINTIGWLALAGWVATVAWTSAVILVPTRKI